VLSALSSTARFFFGLALVALLGAGLPLVWVWVGSQVQAGTRPTAAAIATVMGGMIISYGVILVIASWFKARSDPERILHRRFAWNRSLRDEKEEPEKTTFLENVIIATTLLTAIVVTIWFFFFGDPGVPGV
jgi:hypothetical protein